MRRPATGLANPLPPVLLASVAGLVAPSPALADRADLILAALVLAVALTIDPVRIRDALGARRRVALAVLLPPALLLPLALAVGALFDDAPRDGLVALGLASTEVAAAGLVAAAGGNAAIALAVVTLSLGLTAVTAPVLAPLLVDASVDPGELIVRFSLVVLVPLAVGLAIRARLRDGRIERPAERGGILLLAVLVYASLGELGDLADLGAALLAALLFLGGSLTLALLLRRLIGELRTEGLAFALRDFAVAAALATQLGTPGAAATAAVYGALMLVVAAALAPFLRRRVAT